MRKTNIILLGSLSSGKIKEFTQLFKAYPEIDFKVLSSMAWNPASFREIETGKTYYENAYNKCRLAHFAAKVPTFSDDSGLEVEGLRGGPGVHSRRYAEVQPGQSQDFANNKKLIESLKGLPKAKRKARFACTIIFMVEGVALSADGTLEGSIIDAPRGENGFGYDPLFVPNGYEKTLAELSTDEKNRISHRAAALRNLMALLKEKKIELVRP